MNCDDESSKEQTSKDDLWEPAVGEVFETMDALEDKLHAWAHASGSGGRA